MLVIIIVVLFCGNTCLVVGLAVVVCGKGLRPPNQYTRQVLNSFIRDFRANLETGECVIYTVKRAMLSSGLK